MENKEANLLISLIFIILRLLSFFKLLPRSTSINFIFLKITILNDIENKYTKSELKKIKQSKNEIIFFLGYWQNLFFLKNINNKLSLSKKKIEIKIKDFVNKKINNNTVAIHIRGNERLYFEIKKNHPIPDKEFYNRAINFFKKKSSFHIFTDDEKYANLVLKKIKKKVEVININNHFKNDFEQFLLLTNYKNFIVSNSTFSILASILSPKKNKIILLSNIWAKNKKFPSKLKTKFMKFF